MTGVVEQQLTTANNCFSCDGRQLGRQLLDRALPRVLVGAPAQESRAVAEAAGGDLVVAHFDDELRLRAAAIRPCARCPSGSDRPARCR